MTSQGEPTSALKEAEELALSLSEALSGGDEQEAAELSRRLSQLSLPVTVSIKSQAYPQDSIRLHIGVEDGQSETYVLVTAVVSPHMTIAQLKEKFSQDYGFPPALQRWVIGKRLTQDQETLFSHGVRVDGDKAFLFILSANAACLTRQQHRLDQDQQRIEDGDKTEPTLETPPPPPPPPKPAVAPKPKLGWTCTVCTYFNKPTWPGCELCSSERPLDYKVPPIYLPDQQELYRIQQEELAMLQYIQAQQEEREKNYTEFLATEEQNLIPNSTEIECPICFSAIQPGEGAVLRECLHAFCRDCLTGTIVNSRDAEVACPEACESKLQDREIKALLSEEEHVRFLELRLSIAESRSDHSFHCQTPNCRGWCIYEDEVNQFPCGLCGETNCILCRAIHDGMNCKDYQDDLRIRAENDAAALQTKQLLTRLLQQGEAMKCPRCDIIVQKKDGFRIGDVLSSSSADYMILRSLGSGVYGEVVKCINLNTKKTVAVKILKKLNAFNEAQRELFMALEALNIVGVIHTDIKLDNIMFVKWYDLRIKVIDFGLSLLVTDAIVGKKLQAVKYRSPEILLGLPYTNKIDMWSAGCVLAHLFLQTNLFEVHSEYEMMRQVVQLLGQPEDRLLRTGIYTEKYFTVMEGADGPMWRLKTPEEYSEHRTVDNNVKDSMLKSLDELVCVENLVRVGDTLSSPIADYVILRSLGSGVYGEVVRCINLNTNKIVAVKILKNINAFKEAQRELFMALEALSTVGVIHTDIKLDNIMFVKWYDLRIKVIDFGLAIRDTNIIVGKKLQALGYRSPEILLGLPYTNTIDMWSAGCVLAHLFLQTSLFEVHSEYEMMRQVVQLLGQPEDCLLRTGIYTEKYFTVMEGADGPMWRLKTPEEYNGEKNAKKVMDSTFKSLDDLVDLQRCRTFHEVLHSVELGTR
ncbi:Zinc finger-containing protein 1 [Takifugu flavidus]|uniref:RanBP-type and C3HC4-type zinc finger-containing protein 1 n=1 Tax=Takifugu flavidus TaxID=433684 RepID=A0A5C6N377_9TELE|nr:Zinc finger-containing protein 1 [Takifugu flavidus]